MALKATAYIAPSIITNKYKKSGKLTDDTQYLVVINNNNHNIYLTTNGLSDGPINGNQLILIKNNYDGNVLTANRTELIYSLSDGNVNKSSVSSSTLVTSSSESKPVATTESKPVATTESKPVATTESKPVATTESKPVATTESKPVATTESKPVATTESKPVATTESKPIRKQKWPSKCEFQLTKRNDYNGSHQWLNIKLGTDNYTIYDVVGDGNCFFYSFIYGIKFNEPEIDRNNIQKL